MAYQDQADQTILVRTHFTPENMSILFSVSNFCNPTFFLAPPIKTNIDLLQLGFNYSHWKLYNLALITALSQKKYVDQPISALTLISTPSATLHLMSTQPPGLL